MRVLTLLVIALAIANQLQLSDRLEIFRTPGRPFEPQQRMQGDVPTTHAEGLNLDRFRQELRCSARSD